MELRRYLQAAPGSFSFRIVFVDLLLIFAADEISVPIGHVGDVFAIGVGPTLVLGKGIVVAPKFVATHVDDFAGNGVLLHTYGVETVDAAFIVNQGK